MFRDIYGEEFREKINEDKNSVILDVRTPAEIAQGIIEGAEIIDFNAPDFLDKISALDKSKNYYIYCRSGNRSGQACRVMESMGFAELYNLAGGMLEWDGKVVEK